MRRRDLLGPEAARLLGVSPASLYRAIARNEIPSLRIGGRVLIPRGPFHRLVQDGQPPVSELPDIRA